MYSVVCDVCIFVCILLGKMLVLDYILAVTKATSDDKVVLTNNIAPCLPVCVTLHPLDSVSVQLYTNFGHFRAIV